MLYPITMFSVKLKKKKSQDIQRSEKRGLHLKEETVHRNTYGNDSDARIISQGF